MTLNESLGAARAGVFHALVRHVAAFLSLLFFVVPGARAADVGRGVLTGVVRDSASGDGLPSANVLLPQWKRGMTTQADGEFTFADLPSGTVVVKVVKIGYRSRQVTLTLDANGAAPVEFRLARVPIASATVHVSNSRLKKEQTPSIFAVAPREVKTTAGTLENVFRTLATLPGVVSTGDFTSRLSVRGGGPDQNLVLLDDVEIYNPYRVFGLLSAFNPEAVSDFTLSGGGFPAKYGNRLSSLLLVTNKDGNLVQNDGVASLSITDANIVGSGPLPRGLGGGNKGSWLLTTRRTYYDLVANSFAHTTLPSFLDFQGKLVLQPDAQDRISAFGLVSHERTNASFNSMHNSDAANFFNNVRNDVGGATWTHGRKGAVNKVTGSWYRNPDKLDFNGRFETKSKIPNTGDTTRIASVIFDRTIVIRDAMLRDDLSLQRGAHLFSLGGELHSQRTDLQYRIDPHSDRNPDVGNPTDVRGGSASPDTLLIKRPSTRWAVYAQDDLTLAPAVNLTLGLRRDYSSIHRRDDWQPRAALSYQPDEATTFRFATGRFAQIPGYEKFLDADYFVQPEGSGPLNITSEHAMHYIFGVERLLPGTWKAQAELYLKTFDDLIVGRLESERERQARVASYRFPDSLQGEIPTAAQITSYASNGATGVSRGLDLFLERRAMGDERVWGYASYTYGLANRHVYDRTIAFDYDRRHTVNVVMNFRLAEKWRLGTTTKYASGFPYDPPAGVTVATVRDSLGHIIPERTGHGDLVWVPRFDGVNSLSAGRLPSFQEVDVRVTYNPKWGGRDWDLYVDVINVLNRANVVDYSAILVPDRLHDRPRLARQITTNFPFLPTIGVTLRW